MEAKDKRIDPTQYESIVVKDACRSICGSAGLAVLKLIAGAVCGSLALLADAVHSVADLFSTVGLLVGVKDPETRKKGLSRYQLLVMFIAGGLVVLLGLMLVIKSLANIAGGDFAKLSRPGAFALFAAALSVLVKELMYRLTKASAEKTDSEALMTDAWYHRADALTSVAAFFGVLIARLWAPIMDTAACLFVALFVMREGVDMIEEGLELISTRPCDPELEQRIIKYAEEEGVDLIDLSCMRRGGELYVYLDIDLDPELPLKEAQRQAKELDLKIEKEFPEVADCIVHISGEPEKEEKE